MISMLSRFVRVPYPVRLGMMLVGGGGAGFLAFSMFGLRGLSFFMGGLICVALVLVLYVWIIRLLAKRKAKRFGQQMKSQSGGAPRGVTEAEQLAKLDDLRKKFEEGVETFRTAGKDIYGLPWYLVIGEPGSGKTEAIRRSGIGFPPGLQDELQGTGGTINMSWWFTNSAIIIDTAGRLMFEEVEAAGSSEWKEFLRLLRMNRPNCPVNGLLLVIPVDSLVRDTAEEIQNKASKIAGQLDLVQRTLDIRFPVFVVITKCDLVNGFREFFGDLDSPDQQQQIFGWSNPNPIDEPFNPELLEDHLAVVRQRLEKRRMLLLRDPVPAGDLSEQRVDEVDTLYDFPHSFMRAMPRLKQYLQTCFVSGEWSAKPLFLRGIYFTSSMREGAALDAELAETLGVPVESLPEGRAWERDRAFFLRDLFTRKVFAERGLVTRATNVLAQDRRRRMTVLGVGMVSALLLLLLTWVGGRSLKRTIGQERDLWSYAAGALSRDRASDYPWPPIVAPDSTAPAEFVYQGPIRLRGLGRRMTVGEFQRELQKKIQNPIRIPLIFRAFRPFTKSLDAERREARRVLFEASVLRPTIEMARKKMEGAKAADWTPQATDALGELVRIEADTLKLTYAPGDGIDAPLDLHALFAYLLTRPDDMQTYEYGDRDVWEQILAWCYDREGGRGKWPPAWLSDGTRLPGNRAVDVGSQQFIDHCCNPPELVSLNRQLETVRETWQRLHAFRRDDEKTYRDAELSFLRIFGANMDQLSDIAGYEEIEQEWREQHETLDSAMQGLTKSFAVIEAAYAKLPIYQAAVVQDAYMATVSNSIGEIEDCYRELPLPESWTEVRAKRGEIVESDEELSLVDDIRLRMQTGRRAVEARLAQPAIAEQLAAFQADYTDSRDALAAFSERFPAYVPLAVPEDVRVRKLPWSTLHEQFARMKVSFIHEDLEEFCRKVDDVFKQIGSAESEIPKESIDEIRGRAKLGIGRVGSRNFRSECEQILDNWRKLSGDATADRDTILSLPLKEFMRSYLIMASSPDRDYVAQYWDTVVIKALESLADGAIQEAQAKLPGLRRYARFPLDKPIAGETSLSSAELQEAIDELSKVQPWPAAEEPKNVGDGANTERAAIDQQLQRLRDLQIGEGAVWLAAAKNMLAALPADPGRRLLCTVSLPPVQEQQRLLQAYGKDSIKDDSVLPVWTIIALRRDATQPVRKERTTQAAPTPVGRFMYPGQGFAIEFFKYHGDANPSRTVTYDDPWGALRLLHDYTAEQMPDDAKKWLIQIPLKDDSGHERVIWLELEFEQPLPSLENWPTAKGI